MNKERILAVADAIERHTIPDLGFNMSTFHDSGLRDMSGHGCGTVACIAGWVVALHHGPGSMTDEGQVTPTGRDIDDEAAALLELTPTGLDGLAGELFYAFRRSDRFMTLSDITPDRAVRTLRHLAATGEVDWDLPESDLSDPEHSADIRPVADDAAISRRTAP